MKPHLYTVKQVARMLRVHPATVRRYAKAGDLPFIRMGTKMLILAGPLEKLLEPSAA